MFGIDHRVPPAEVQLANNLKFCRDKCREYGISRFAEIGRHGIGHQLMSEGFGGRGKSPSARILTPRCMGDWEPSPAVSLPLTPR
jgi:hypothetical protein